MVTLSTVFADGLRVEPIPASGASHGIRFVKYTRSETVLCFGGHALRVVILDLVVDWNRLGGAVMLAKHGKVIGTRMEMYDVKIH